MNNRAQMVMMLFMWSASLTQPSEAPFEQLCQQSFEVYVKVLLQPWMALFCSPLRLLYHITRVWFYEMGLWYFSF